MYLDVIHAHVHNCALYHGGRWQVANYSNYILGDIGLAGTS